MQKSRQTKIRIAITQIFQAYPEPLTLSDMFQYVKIAHPNTAYSTVFRLVLKLMKEGKVVQVDWRERGSRYEWAELPHHHHIVCQTCGKIVDIADTELNFDEKKLEQSTGFLVKHHSIELEGICGECQKKSTGSDA